MAASDSKQSSKLVKTVLLIVLIVGLSIASTFFLLKQFGPSLFGVAQPAMAVQQEKPPEVPKPIFLPLESFTVTLNEPRANRILYTEISLRVLDDSSRQQIQTYMPEVRSRVLAEIARHDSISLQSTEGRTQLTQNLLAALKVPYDSQLASPAISSVLFTAFVVQ